MGSNYLKATNYFYITPCVKCGFTHASQIRIFTPRDVKFRTTIFLAVQLFRSPLIIVRIKSQYSFDSKKNYEKKKFPIFWYFSPNLAPYWIRYWIKLNFDHGFLKSTPKTTRKHGFRLKISRFQS